jgi:adenylate cyclase
MADEGVRLAAILAADVVGYRLMEADEEGTHTRLKGLRKTFIEPALVEHHGRIVKLTGDGALVEFASAVDAVKFAVEVQRGIAERNGGLREEHQLWFRIGINIGDIIIEDDDIYGDGVNIAARPKALLTSASTGRGGRIDPGDRRRRVVVVCRSAWIAGNDERGA